MNKSHETPKNYFSLPTILSMVFALLPQDSFSTDSYEYSFDEFDRNLQVSYGANDAYFQSIISAIEDRIDYFAQTHSVLYRSNCLEVFSKNYIYIPPYTKITDSYLTEFHNVEDLILDTQTKITNDGLLSLIQKNKNLRRLTIVGFCSLDDKVVNNMPESLELCCVGSNCFSWDAYQKHRAKNEVYLRKILNLPRSNSCHF